MAVLRIIRDWRVLTALVVILVALVSFRGKVARGMEDFEVYRTAGNRVMSGDTLYQASDQHWKFKYLPAFAFCVIPISLLPDHTARVAWFALSMWLVVALVVMSFELLPSRRHSAVFVVGFSVLVMAKFYAREVSLGQTNVLLAVFVLLAVYFLRRGLPTGAGICLAFATIVKPYAIIFLAYLLFRKRWGAAAAFVVVLAGAILLPALRYGMSGNAQLLAAWWSTVSGSTASTLTASDNISLAALYAKWLGAGPLATWLAASTAVMLVAACAYVFLTGTRVQFPDYLDTALLLTLIPLLSPQGWDYVLLVATPAVMLLAGNLPVFNRGVQAAILAALIVPGLTLWDLVGPRFYGAFMATSVVTLCYLVVAASLVRLRQRQIA